MSRSNLLQRLAEEFVVLHETKEDLFWEMAQGVSDHPAQVAEDLARAQVAMDRFRQDPNMLGLLSAARGAVTAAADRDAIQAWTLFFDAYTVADPAARRLSEEIVERETALVEACKQMKTGVVDPTTGAFTPMGPNAILQLVNNHPEEAHRRSAYEALLQVETYVLEHGLLDVVRLRNRLARSLGYEDFYDLRTSRIERMRKKTLFALLDRLAEELTPRVRAQVASLERKGRLHPTAPWNFTYHLQGSLVEMLDEYYPLSRALLNWLVGFAGMGIDFGGAELTLDLLERPGKYPNGYMHAPGIPRPRGGTWSTARANILTHGNPGALGTGLHVTKTLYHEGGHAAHLARIRCAVPCLATEYPPESTSHLEAQSMFCEMAATDAGWRSRYAFDRDEKPMPEGLILEAALEEKRSLPARVLGLLAIAMGERALYETPDDRLTPDYVRSQARQVERRVLGLDAGPRPLFAVPHLRSGESSATYHAYPLALTAVFQMRAALAREFGPITDNRKIGPELARHCWEQGSRASLADTIKSITGGHTFSPEAFIAHLQEREDEAVARMRQEIAHVARTPHIAVIGADVNARIRVVHGRDVIADSRDGVMPMFDAFEAWIKRLEEEKKRPAS